MNGFKDSVWSIPYLGVIIITSAIVLAFLGTIFGKIEANIVKGSTIPDSRTIPTYLALFIFAEVSQPMAKW